jgi:hypothetical protein
MKKFLPGDRPAPFLGRSREGGFFCLNPVETCADKNREKRIRKDLRP